MILNKSSELRFRLRRRELIFRTWARPVQLWSRGCVRAFVGSDETVSIVKIVSLSPRVKYLKLKEGNKSFVPEPRKSSAFRVFRIPMRINILWTYYEHFIHPYISRINICNVTPNLDPYNQMQFNVSLRTPLFWKLFVLFKLKCQVNTPLNCEGYKVSFIEDT